MSRDTRRSGLQPVMIINSTERAGQRSAPHCDGEEARPNDETRKEQKAKEKVIIRIQHEWTEEQLKNAFPMSGGMGEKDRRISGLDISGDKEE